MDTFLYALRSFDGPLYYITAVICVIFIMAIIGFLMERSLKMEEAEALKKSDTSIDGVIEVSRDEALNTETQAAEEMTHPITPGIIDFTETTKKEETPTENLVTSPSIPEVEPLPIATNESIPEIK